MQCLVSYGKQSLPLKWRQNWSAKLFYACDTRDPSSPIGPAAHPLCWLILRLPEKKLPLLDGEVPGREPLFGGKTGKRSTSEKAFYMRMVPVSSHLQDGNLWTGCAGTKSLDDSDFGGSLIVFNKFIWTWPMEVRKAIIFLHLHHQWKDFQAASWISFVESFLETRIILTTGMEYLRPSRLRSSIFRHIDSSK